MSDFPTLYCEASLQMQSVPGPVGREQRAFQVFQGTDASFHPATLPAPTWFIAVNPDCGEGLKDSDIDLNDWFGPGNQDAELLLLRGALAVDVRQALWARAKDDAEDHVTCNNGGLYSLWELANGELVLGGFDNGGSCIASFLTELADTLGGQIVTSGGDSHFDPEGLLDPECLHQLAQEEKNMSSLSQLLQEQKKPAGLRPHL